MGSAGPIDRSVPAWWLAAFVAAAAAWGVLGSFKSGPAELTVVVPLFTPGAIFVPIAIEVRRRFGGTALAVSTAAAVVVAAFTAGAPLLNGMDIGTSPGFFWIAPALWAPSFAAVAFVEHRLAARRPLALARDLPIAIVVLIAAQVVTFAIVVVMLVLGLPRIG